VTLQLTSANEMARRPNSQTETHANLLIEVFQDIKWLYSRINRNELEFNMGYCGNTYDEQKNRKLFREKYNGPKKQK